MTIDEIIRSDLLHEAQAKPTFDRDRYKRFYNSKLWRQLRYETLKRYGGRCQACGRSANNGVTLVCDHILPVRHHWDKRLDPENIQVLCQDDNLAKASSDTSDWRTKSDGLK